MVFLLKKFHWFYDIQGNYANYVPFDGYHYNYTTSSSTEQYHAFLSAIVGEIDLSSRQTKPVRNQAGSVIGYATTYRCIDKYKDYRVEDRNCFCAVGDWVNALGDNRFYGFASIYPYTDYRVQNMLANYPQYWNSAGSYSSY